MQTAYKSPVKVNTMQKGQNSNSISVDELTDISFLEEKIVNSPIPEGLQEKALNMIKRLYRMAKFGSYSGEYELIEKYINWIVSIPWGSKTVDNLDLKNANQILESRHFGLRYVKDRILEFLSVAKLTPAFSEDINPSDDSGRSLILAFVGIQGIGKTSMAKSIAQALGRKFYRISLGAMGSVLDIKGQSRAFLDAEPGQIVKALVRTKTMNPVILLDEIDKISEVEGRRADINSALLEILDPEQNDNFMDSYVDYPVDLSKVLFITTANSLSTLSAALLDRLEIIRFPSYSDEEKEQIGRKYIFPKVLKACGLSDQNIEFVESVWPLIIRPLGFDAGVRQLERNLLTICRKVARKIVEGEGTKFIITPQNIKEFLPPDMGVYS